MSPEDAVKQFKLNVKSTVKGKIFILDKNNSFISNSKLRAIQSKFNMSNELGK